MYKILRLEITNRCNLRCKYCHATDGDDSIKEYGLSELESIIEEGRGLGCEEVVFIGGEPLMHPNFWELVKKSSIPKVIITTNSTLFGKENLKKLSEDKKIKEVRLSIDGLGANDKNREGSSYKQILRTAEEIKKIRNDIRLVVQTTCYNENIDELEFLYEELKKINIDKWRISLVWDVGRARGKDLFSYFQFDRLIKKFKKIILKYLDDKAFELEIYNTYNSNLGIEEYGSFAYDISPCDYYSDILCVCVGNKVMYCPKFKDKKRFKESISETLDVNKKFTGSLTNIKIKDLSCAECRYLKLCGGGCRANAFSYYGDLKGPDPIACKMLPLVEKEIVPILPKFQAEVYYSHIDYDKNLPREIFGSKL